MASIKITGYLNIDDLDDDEVDLTSPTGLTDKGYTNVVTSQGGYKVADLEDLEIELDEDDE